MGMARRPVGPGSSSFAPSLSPDPLMGRRGFPLLLASGETANGAIRSSTASIRTTSSWSCRPATACKLSARSSLFVYAGLPGEPAFGPPPFMHRLSAHGFAGSADQPPLARFDPYQLRSGHRRARSSATSSSRLRASTAASPTSTASTSRPGRSNSTALRLSWNPARTLSLQASWARLIEPGAARAGGEPDALVGERAIQPAARPARAVVDDPGLGPPLGRARAVSTPSCSKARWRGGGGPCSARAERTENDELGRVGGHHGPAYRVGKVSLWGASRYPGGAARPARPRRPVGLQLRPGRPRAFLCRRPEGAMLFLRLRID